MFPTILTLALCCSAAAGCGGLKAGPPTLASQRLAVIDTSVHTVNAVLEHAVAVDSGVDSSYILLILM
jgi:hypothetical protein